jgi:putative phosphoribosyl transferase
MGVTRDQLADVIAREAAELQRRDALYRGARPPLPVEGRVVIVVDDGVATGASMRVALQALRARPARIVAAVPVACRCRAYVRRRGRRVRHGVAAARFFGIGQFYADFDQVGDDEVRALLDAARVRHDGISPA